MSSWGGLEEQPAPATPRYVPEEPGSPRRSCRGNTAETSATDITAAGCLMVKRSVRRKEEQCRVCGEALALNRTARAGRTCALYACCRCATLAAKGRPQLRVCRATRGNPAEAPSAP